MAQALPIPDDLSIEPDDLLYRRIKDGGGINVVTNADGERKPSSAAFEDDDDGISVFLHSTLSASSLEPADVISGFDGYVVARIRVRDVRELGIGIVRDPNPADAKNMPCNVAHCLLKHGDLSKTQNHKLRQKIARIADLLD